MQAAASAAIVSCCVTYCRDGVASSDLVMGGGGRGGGEEGLGRGRSGGACAGVTGTGG